MHLVGEDQRRPNKGRLKSESFFKRMNNCVLAVQLACFLTITSLASIAAGKTTTSSFWSNQAIVFEEMTTAKTFNCSQNVTVGIAGWEPSFQVISPDDLYYRYASFAGRTRMTIVLNGITLIVGALNKLIFELNIFEVRIRHLIIRKEIVSVTELLFIIFSYVTTADIEEDAKVLQSYFQYCGIQRQDTLPYQPPFVWFYISLSWVLLFHVISAMFLAYHTLQDPPPIPTTRNKFSQNLSESMQVVVAEKEHLPEHAAQKYLADPTAHPHPRPVVIYADDRGEVP